MVPDTRLLFFEEKNKEMIESGFFIELGGLGIYGGFLLESFIEDFNEIF
jgi:hypothetical protein